MLAWLHDFLREFSFLAPIVDVSRLVIFGLFVFLGLRIARRPGDTKRVNTLLVFCLAVTTAVGLIQIESWPFSNWALVWARAPERMTSWEIVAIDRQGAERIVDPRVLQPLGNEDFGNWFLRNFPGLEPGRKDAVAAHVLDAAEEGRKRFRAGRSVGDDSRWLGPFATLRHFVPAEHWREPEDAGSESYVAVRLYRLTWKPQERATEPRRVNRELIHEFRP